MDKKNILVATGALILGIIIGLISDCPWFQSQNWHSDTMMDRNNDRNTAGMNMNHSMHGMMSVKNEQEFLEHMIPHHEEAVETAKDVLARGGTTEGIRTLLNNVITAQEKEIADMKAWYASWYGKDYYDTGSYQKMMRDLSNLSGADLDRAWLEDMIHHHMGAIMMAESIEDKTTHEELYELGHNITKTQSEEIALMKKLLAESY